MQWRRRQRLGYAGRTCTRGAPAGRGCRCARMPTRAGHAQLLLLELGERPGHTRGGPSLVRGRGRGGGSRHVDQSELDVVRREQRGTAVGVEAPHESGATGERRSMHTAPPRPSTLLSRLSSSCTSLHCAALVRESQPRMLSAPTVLTVVPARPPPPQNKQLLPLISPRHLARMALSCLHSTDGGWNRMRGTRNLQPSPPTARSHLRASSQFRRRRQSVLPV